MRCGRVGRVPGHQRLALLDTLGSRLARCGHTTSLVGRLVVLGSCGKRVVYALARWGGIITIIGSYRKARRVQSLTIMLAIFTFAFKFIGYVFGTFGVITGSLICRRPHPRSVYPSDFGVVIGGGLAMFAARLAFDPRKPLSAQISILRHYWSSITLLY